MIEEWPRLDTGRATTRTQQTHQRAKPNRALPTLRLSKGAAMWRCCFRGNRRAIERTKLSGETRAPTFRCWPLRSKCAFRPSLYFPQYQRTLGSAVLFGFRKFELSRLLYVTVAALPAHLLNADKIRVFSSAMSVDRSVFSLGRPAEVRSQVEKYAALGSVQARA